MMKLKDLDLSALSENPIMELDYAEETDGEILVRPVMNWSEELFNSQLIVRTQFVDREQKSYIGWAYLNSTSQICDSQPNIIFESGELLSFGMAFQNLPIVP